MKLVGSMKFVITNCMTHTFEKLNAFIIGTIYRNAASFLAYIYTYFQYIYKFRC